MIPKILHFVWIGDKKTLPPYADFIIDQFKEKNPEFEIQLHQHTIDEILDEINNKKNEMFIQIFKDMLNEKIRKAKYNLDKFEKTKKFYKWDVWLNNAVLLADAFRFNLINNVGGIYCDLDCYPIKPFDESLLSLDCFFMECCHTKNMPDIFFIGAAKNKLLDLNKTILKNPLFNFQNISYSKLKQFKEHLYQCNKNAIEDFISKYSIDSYIIHPHMDEKYEK